MSCNHPNAPSHAYCVVCGVALDRCRCPRCGVANEPRYLFCAACGQSMRSPAAAEQTIASVLPHTYDLDALRLTAGKSKPSADESSIKLTQDDIKKLLESQLKGGA